MRAALRVAIRGARIRQPYLGAVSRRGFVSDNVANSGANYQTMTRTLYVAPHDLVGPRPLLPIGWYAPQANNTETVQAGSYTTTCSLEYPLGTIAAQYQFGGLTTGAFSGGAVAIPDAITKVIPAGATYAIRWWLNSVNGWCYRNNFPKVTGDGFNSGTTTADLTDGSGAGPAGGLGNVGSLSVVPLGVIAQTTAKSVLLLGDSIQNGATTDTATAAGDQGIGARIVGPTLAYTNCGVSSTRASQFTAANASRRIALAQYFTHVFCNYGVNDCLSSIAAATTAGELARIVALFAKPVVLSTITPVTNGSGSAWTSANGSDQVLSGNASTISNIVDALNALIRSGIAGAAGFVDVRAIVQNASAAQKWKAPSQTSDGVHPTAAMYATIASDAPGRLLLL